MKPPFLASVIRRRGAGKLCCKIGVAAVRGASCRCEGCRSLNPRVRAEVEPAGLLVLLSCCELRLDMLIDQPSSHASYRCEQVSTCSAKARSSCAVEAVDKDLQSADLCGEVGSLRRGKRVAA